MGKEQSPGPESSEPASLNDARDRKMAEFMELLERSSLGTPAAKAIRRRSPPGAAEAAIARARELAGTPDATVTPITARRRPKKG